MDGLAFSFLSPLLPEKVIVESKEAWIALCFEKSPRFCLPSLFKSIRLLLLWNMSIR